MVTVGDNKPLAQGLHMSSTYRLRFEAFFRHDDGTNWRTLFHGTDGGSFTSGRCGGRLPGIWIRNHAPPIRHALKFNRNCDFIRKSDDRPVNFKVELDSIYVAVSMDIQIVVTIQTHSSLTDGLQ